jgi:hypothetical protein
MPFVTTTDSGLVLGLSESVLSDFEDNVHYVNQELFEQISNHPNNYVYYEEQFHLVPMPDLYHSWDSTNRVWVLDDVVMAKARDEMAEKVKELRDTRKYKGFNIVLSGGSYWIHSDDPSRIQLLGLALASVLSMINPTVFPFPVGKQWKTMAKNPDGSPIKIVLTSAIALQVVLTFLYVEGINYEVCESHIAAINTSSDPLAYDYSTGWTPVFGEV